MALQIGTKLSVCSTGFGFANRSVVHGTDGHGEHLTPQQIKQALKIN